MRLAVLILAICVTVSLSQMHAGTAWQGEWSDGTWICVDPMTQTAHGQAGGIRLFSGYLWGNSLTGFWYEAGYDRPFGPFQLTISGGSFSGSYSYYEAPELGGSWSANRVSNEKPERYQCLAPSGSGAGAQGYYEPGNYLCYNPNVVYQNTNQESVWGSFAAFGDVQGFTPDNGVTFLMSDFYFPDDDDTNDNRYRPPNSEGPGFGPGACPDCDDDGDIEDHNYIPTKRIVVGRFIDDSQFCGYFWEGLYHTLIGGGAICLQRTEATNPDLVLCGGDVSYVNAQIDQMETGLTSWILDQVQQAFDALDMPEVIIVGGPGRPISRSGNAASPGNSPGSPGSPNFTPGGSPANSPSSNASSLVVSVFALAVALFIIF